MTAPALERLCSANLARPHGFEPLRLEGRLPSALSGTLYRAGPGKFDTFGHRYRHLFEGDGAITAIRIADGAAEGACRLLRSTGHLEEQSAGRPLYGSAAPWWRRFVNTHTGRGKNTGNTNIICYQETLYALMEAAKPTRIEPETLSVRGEQSFGGVVRGPMSAHPHRVPSRECTYSYGVRYGRHPKLELYAMPDRGAVRHLGSVPLKAGPMLHDFIVTERHLIFFVPPAVVNVPRALLQLGDFGSLFEWRPALGTEVICVPIDAPQDPVRFRTDAFFQWHFANAFESGEEIVVDFLHYPDFASFRSIGQSVPDERGGTYHRATLDPGRRTLKLEQQMDVPADFPRIHPACEAVRHRHVWIMTEEQPQRLIGLDLGSGAQQSHRFAETERASEAVMAPTGRDETDGYLLSLVYCARADVTYLAVFDPTHLADGPIAKAFFDHHIPITFHGNWVGSIS